MNVFDECVLCGVFDFQLWSRRTCCECRLGNAAAQSDRSGTENTFTYVWHPLRAWQLALGRLFAPTQVCSVHTARHGTPTSNMKFYNVSLVWLPLRLGLNRP